MLRVNFSSDNKFFHGKYKDILRTYFLEPVGLVPHFGFIHHCVYCAPAFVGKRKPPSGRAAFWRGRRVRKGAVLRSYLVSGLVDVPEVAVGAELAAEGFVRQLNAVGVSAA